MTDPLIRRNAIRSQVGTSVADLRVELLCDAGSTLNGEEALAFALSGGFDGALVSVDRVYASAWGVTPAGNLSSFVGRIADVEVESGKITIDAKAMTELLNVQMPINLYQATCIHTLYGPGCNLSAAAFTDTGAVGANATRSVIPSNLAATSDYYALGVVAFTSGPNAGLTRTVKAYATGGNITLGFPLPVAPGAADSFDIRPGCDKLQTTCNAKFSNTANIRLYPYIPVPEASY